MFANLRPVRAEGVDVMIVRELSGGLYYGRKGRLDATGWRSTPASTTRGRSSGSRAVRSSSPAAAGDAVTLVDKYGVLETSALWREVVDEVATDYPDVRWTAMLVDNAAMQLVRDPGRFDVLLTENTFGDILSDVAAVATGGVGLAPSASLGERRPRDLRADPRLCARHRGPRHREPGRDAALGRADARVRSRPAGRGAPARRRGRRGAALERRPSTSAARRRPSSSATRSSPSSERREPEPDGPDARGEDPARPLRGGRDRAGRLRDGATCDVVMANDLGGPHAARELVKMGVERVFDPSKVVIVADHLMPAKDIRAAELLKALKEWCDRQGVTVLRPGARRHRAHRARRGGLGRAGVDDRRSRLAQLHLRGARGVRDGDGRDRHRGGDGARELLADRARARSSSSSRARRGTSSPART